MNRNTLALIIPGNIVMIIQCSIFLADIIINYSFHRTGIIILEVILYLLIFLCIYLITKYIEITKKEQ